MLPRGFGKERRVAGPVEDAVPLKRSAEATEDLSIDVPLTHHVELRQHKKTVATLDVDRSGSRLVTGSHDYTLALWDFAGMDRTFNPFRFLQPTEGCPVRVTKFSTTGDAVVVAGGGTLRLLDRHGAFLQEYNKGDPYLRDMRNTHGHTSAILSGAWDPLRRDRFATSGQDGTIRFWAVEGKKNCEMTLVVRTKNTPDGRHSAPVTQIKYLPGATP